MARARETIDRRPGPAPEIRATGDSVTFGFAVGALQDGLQLVIRCDAEGNVWASIVRTNGPNR